MPINLEPSNSIIQAFLAGRQLRDRRAAEAEETRRYEENKKVQADIRAQEQKRYEEETKRAIDLQDQQIEIARQLRDFDIQKKAVEMFQSGVMPTSYTEVGRTGSFPIGEGYATTKAQLASAFHPSFESFEPIDLARQQAEIERITKGPAYEQELDKILLQKQADAAIREAESQASYKRTIDAAKIRAEATREAARIRGATALDRQKYRLLDKDEQEAYNLPSGSTVEDSFGKMPGIKLSTTQLDDLKSLDVMEIRATQLLKMLEDNKWAYYKGVGPEGIKLESYRAANIDRGQWNADISTLIGDIRSILGHERFGSSFTFGESARLKSFEPDIRHTTPVTEAKAKLKGFLENIIETKKAITKNTMGRTIQPGSPDLETLITPEMRQKIIDAFKGGK